MLGVSVFDRGEDFDCRIDPIVRVQARNLRRRLAVYYASAGALDPVVIELPRGSYEPTVRYAYRGVDGVGKGHAGASGASGTSDFTVGREVEMRDLRVAIDAAKEGRGSLALVCGEAGVGKTTLVRKALGEISIASAIGLCSERLVGAEAYLPVLEALEDLLRRQADAGILLREVAPSWYVQLFPYSVNDPSRGGVLAEARSAAPQRLKREFLSFLHEFTRDRPLALFIDDIHWADPSTLDLLLWLAGRCSSERLLLVAAYRNAELLGMNSAAAQALGDLEAKALVRKVRPGLLSHSEIEELLNRKYAEHTLPEGFIAFLGNRTEGNPLFLTELLNELEDLNHLVGDGGRWRLSEGFDYRRPGIPATIRATIERTILRLPEADRELLRFAAVQGNEFDSTVLSRVTQRDIEVVESRLNSLEKGPGLVRCQTEDILPDGTLSTRYVFVHVLYQNALFQSLSVARRTRMCRAMGEAIHQAYGEESNALARVANLFEMARDFDRAVSFFLPAARKALDRSLHREATNLATRGKAALDQCTALSGARRRTFDLDFSLVLGRCCMSASGFGSGEAKSHYAHAITLAATMADDAKHLEARRGLLAYYLAQAKYEEAEAESRLLHDLAMKSGDKPLLVEAVYGISFTLSQRGRLLEALPLQRMAIELHEQCAPSGREFVFALNPGVGCRLQQAMNLWMLGQPDSGLRLCDEALTLARSSNDLYGVGFSLMYTAVLHELRGEAQQTKARAEDAISLAEEHGFDEILGWALLERGWAVCELGESELGIATIRRVLAVQQSRGSKVARPHFLASLAECYLHSGSGAQALEAAQEGLAASAETGAHYFEAELHRLAAMAYLDCANREAADREFAFALRVAQEQAAKSWEVRILTSWIGTAASEAGAERLARLETLLGQIREGAQTRDLARAAAVAQGARARDKARESTN